LSIPVCVDARVFHELPFTLYSGSPDFPISESISRREPGSLRTEFVQQRLRVLQIRGVEALGEPVVDFGEHRVSFVALALLGEQSCEAGRRAKLQRSCIL